MLFRHAILNGFEVTLFDKRDVIGGRWNSNGSSSYLHYGTRMQYSAEISAFSDFPSKIKGVMNQKEAVEYLLDYAKTYNLQKISKLNTEVVEVRRHTHYDDNGKWMVKYRNSNCDSEIKEDEFEYVLICTGMKQKPWRPNEYRLEGAFRGRISHSSDFKSADQYYDKTIVLVGFGNSAADIARALGYVAKKVCLIN